MRCGPWIRETHGDGAAAARIWHADEFRPDAQGQLSGQEEAHAGGGFAAGFHTGDREGAGHKAEHALDRRLHFGKQPAALRSGETFQGITNVLEQVAPAAQGTLEFVDGTCCQNGVFLRGGDEAEGFVYQGDFQRLALQPQLMDEHRDCQSDDGDHADK